MDRLAHRPIDPDIPALDPAPTLSAAAATAPPLVLSEAKAPGDLRQLVAAGSMRFIIGFDESREYVDAVASLTRIPRSPSWLLGAFSADGNAVPLVDIYAWAHQTEPTRWKPPGHLAGSRFEAREGHHPGSPSAGTLRALRMGDGASAWAIRVTEAPAVISLAQNQSRAISSTLPLAVSSVNGHLMPHAMAAWFLAGDVVALQIRWAALADVLRQELAGISTAERRKE